MVEILNYLVSYQFWGFAPSEQRACIVFGLILLLHIVMSLTGQLILTVHALLIEPINVIQHLIITIMSGANYNSLTAA